MRQWVYALGVIACAPSGATAQTPQENGVAYARALTAADRTLQAWLRDADAKTGLMPDRLDGEARVATPHNFSADLYPYLILTARLTDPALYEGRMLEMLRSEVRYMTAAASVPGNLDLRTGALGEPSLFGAGEYAKDGLITVTELLGRTPWFYRMTDLIADAMARAPHDSRWGRLPAVDSELNGDFLQVLVRLYTMTGDGRYLAWARRIGDAYVEDVLPNNFGVPSTKWDFATHTGEPQLRLRDHGNELVVGLTLLFALESDLQSERAARYAPVVRRMLDQVLASANPDGMLYNQVDAKTLAPVNRGLSDNWGYVYGAVYTFYQVTGDVKYRDAVRKVLANLPKYEAHVWEPRPNDARLTLGSFDGYADTIESALYLVNREPVPGALAWIESETARMLAMLRPDGHLEDWYGEGNFNRTLLIYALMKSQGVMPAERAPGLRLGAVRDGDALRLHVSGVPAVRLQFDLARHRRVINLARNYVRLNEFPEWFVVEPNWLYRVSGGSEPARVRLGAELMTGERFAAGEWRIEPLGPPPYGHRTDLAPATTAAQATPPYAPKQSDRPSPIEGDEPGFVPIFDGRSLEGWDGDPTYWRVENGALVGEITPATLVKSNTFIIWRGGRPKDFELKLEYRITPGGNSGVNYRSASVPDPVTPANRFALRGYQFDLDGGRRYTGNNYEEKGRLFLAVRGQVTRVVGGRPPIVVASLGDEAQLATAATDEWNTVHVSARGNTLTHVLNGRLMSVTIDDDAANRPVDGVIGVQVHVGGPMKVEYRNIRLKTW